MNLQRPGPRNVHKTHPMYTRCTPDVVYMCLRCIKAFNVMTQLFHVVACKFLVDLNGELECGTLTVVGGMSMCIVGTSGVADCFV